MAILSACAVAGTPLQEIAPEINATVDRRATLLVAGDTLEVVFPLQEEFDQTTKIRQDGMASFLKIGELQCAGLTIEQLTSAIEVAYRSVKEIERADPTVRISIPVPRSIYVIGDVDEPGPIEVPIEGLSLLEALGAAGGPRKETASMEQLLLVRWTPREKQVRVWEIDASEEYWPGPERIELLPGDVVFVPNTPIDDVDIWVDQYIRRLIPLPMPAIPY